MNNKLIEKVIQTNIGVCPDLFYKNPVLDRQVAKALAKSFVKILRLSEQNSTVHNNLRISILENIRRICVIEPTAHIPVDENLTAALSELYINQTQFLSKNSTDRDLDAFLMKKYKTINVSSQFESTVNPEIVQALLNLNENGVYLEILAKDIVHWDTNKGNFLNIIKDLWKTDEVDKCVENMYDDLAIKMKPEIEKILLNVCHDILQNENVDLDDIFSNSNLEPLIKRCSVSSECFQICTGALNFIFIVTNYDFRLQTFIPAFINKVKMYCQKVTFSVLYPLHVNHIVVMLDIRINVLPEQLRISYITPTLKYMKELREKSEHDFIMLLSHFPQWFDIYFQNMGDVPPIS